MPYLTMKNGNIDQLKNKEYGYLDDCYQNNLVVTQCWNNLMWSCIVNTMLQARAFMPHILANPCESDPCNNFSSITYIHTPFCSFLFDTISGINARADEYGVRHTISVSAGLL